MFGRIFSSALAAGFAAGVLMAALQFVTTTPLILEAEIYENGGEAQILGAPSVPAGLAEFSFGIRPASAHGTADEHAAEQPWAPGDGMERVMFTSLATVIGAVGFALLLVAAMALKGDAVDGRRGVLWGMGAFAAITLAPALGLSPEVPGSVAAALPARQLWWIATIFASAGGLWLLVFRPGVAWVAAGLALLVLPHVIGAPHPAEGHGTVPPELAAQFAATSIAIAAVFWAMLGWFSGTFYKRFG